MKSSKTITFLLLCYLFMFSQAGVVIQSDLKGEQLKDGDKIVENPKITKYSMPEKGAKVIWGPTYKEAKNGEKREFVEFFKKFLKRFHNKTGAFAAIRKK